MKLHFLLCLFVFSCLACKKTKVEAPIDVSLEYEIRLSKSADISNASVLLLLHGYGSHEKDLFSFSSFLDEDMTLIAVRAPITLQEGKYAWYNINIGQGNTKYAFEDVQKSKQHILKFIKQVKSKYNLRNQKVYLGGFSQGAIMSLYVGLTAPELIEGVVALSGHLYPEVQSEIDFSQAHKFPSIFLSHGRNDNVLSFEKAQEGVRFLESHNIAVDEYWYESKHNISKENILDMRTWLQSKMKK